MLNRMDTMAFPVKRAMVVEDCRHFSSIICMVLKSLGVEQIVEVADGRDAIEALEAFDAELVIMDWMMPNMDGVECTRRIRSSRGRYPDVPIVMVTARDDVADIQRALEAGADAYISKPVSSRRLLAGFLSAVAASA